MLAPSSPDRLRIAFDDDRLVDHAGLLLPATLAGRLGLRELTDAHLDLGQNDQARTWYQRASKDSRQRDYCNHKLQELEAAQNEAEGR